MSQLLQKRPSTRQRTALARLALAIIIVGAALVLGRDPFGSTAAVLTDSQPVEENTFGTRLDWQPPTVDAVLIENEIGYADIVRPDGSYYVCANLSDAGNPSSGVDSVTANVAVAGNVVTLGGDAITVRSGSYTCAGASFGFRSRSQSADAGLPDGERSYQVAAEDGAGNVATSTSWTVTIDGTRLLPTQLSTSNAATAGVMEAGDSFTVTLDGSDIDLANILAGWDGSTWTDGLALKVFDDDKKFGDNDGLALCHGGTGAKCKASGDGQDNILGRVDLGATDYVTGGPVVFDATIAWDGGTRTLTVTVGTCASGCASVTSGSAATATFEPKDGEVRDRAGNSSLKSDTISATGVLF